MTNESQIVSAAEEAADKIIERMRADLAEDGIDGAVAEPLLQAMRPGLVIAWIEGRQAGGEEAKAIVSEYMGRMRRELTRVPHPNREIVLFVDAADEWRFRIEAANGETIAASEGYSRKIDALHTAQSLAPGATVREEPE